MIQRMTHQRTVVREAVRTLKTHATVDEIYEIAKQACPAISKATVYRNLQQLSEAGEIRKLEIPVSADRYDHRTSNHYHVRCTVCGRVSDADMDYIPDLQQRIKDTHGYFISGHSVVFSGVCPRCRNKEE